MKKKIMIYLSLCLLILTGCMGGKTYPEIKLDPGNGGVKSISMDDAIAKKDNGENFLLIVTQSNCLYCMDSFAQSDDNIKEKGIMLWCIILDEEDYSEQQNLKLVHEHFGDFSSTPSLYYVGEGTTQDTLLSSEQEVSLESYKKWLKENHIVE